MDTGLSPKKEDHGLWPLVGLVLVLFSAIGATCVLIALVGAELATLVLFPFG
jgi:hypothetical protein